MSSQTTIHSLPGTVKVTRLTAINPPPSRQQQGFTVLESLLWLMSVISCWVLVAHYSQRQVEATRATATARQLNTVSRQAYQWTLDHWELLQQQGTQSDASQVLDLLPLLRKADSRFKTPNPYQQDYRIQLIPVANQLNPTDNRWQLWVTTHEGKTISPRVCRQISDQVGASAGFITHNAATAASTLIGWRGLWTVPWPQALGSAPPAGHLATLQTIDLPILTSANQILHRKPVVGISTANQVNTDLTLNNSAITLSNSPQQGRLNSQQWQFTQGTQALQIKNDPQQTAIQLKDDIIQATRITPHDLTINNALLFGETQEKTVQLHKFLFRISETTKSSGFILSQLKGLFPNQYQKPKNNLLFRESQCTSQIHSLWNKIPYHEWSPKNSELPSPVDFANSICQDSSDNHQALGRFFIVGNSDITRDSQLFICIKSSEKIQAHSWKKIAAYQDPGTSTVSNAPVSLPQYTIKINLPENIENDREKKRIHDLLTKITESISFFIKAAEKYEQLNKNSDVCIKKDHLKDGISKNPLFKKLEKEEFNTLFNIYCQPLFSGKSKEINPSLIKKKYEEIKSPAKFIINCNSINNHEMPYLTAYKYYKNPDSLEPSKTIKYIINALNEDDDSKSILPKEVIQDIFTRLQKNYPDLFKKYLNHPSEMIGIDIPDQISSLQDAEEILSFLIILSTKIQELFYLDNSNKTIITKAARKLIHKFNGKGQGFYGEIENILSDYNICHNKEEFLRQFMEKYNSSSNSQLNKFIDRIKNIKNFIGISDNNIKEIINQLLFEIVDTHYKDSRLIKVRYAEDNCS